MKKLKWVVEFEVAECWVEDGFNPDHEDVTRMLGEQLPFAESPEFSARIVSAPCQKTVATLQGYKSIAAMLRDKR